jgi:hypothetical protein
MAINVLLIIKAHRGNPDSFLGASSHFLPLFTQEEERIKNENNKFRGKNRAHSLVTPFSRRQM